MQIVECDICGYRMTPAESTPARWSAIRYNRPHSKWDMCSECDREVMALVTELAVTKPLRE